MSTSRARSIGRGKTTPASTAGSFATYAHGVPGVVLDAGADPAGQRIPVPERARIEDYFAGHVANFDQTPWRLAGTHITLYQGDWAKMPRAHIAPAGLYATQSRLFKKHLARHLGHTRPSAEQAVEDAAPGRDLPWVVEYRGRRWVHDGHHRIAAAVLRRQPSIEVYLMRLNDPLPSSAI